MFGGHPAPRSEMEAALYGTIEERETSTVLYVDFLNQSLPHYVTLNGFNYSKSNR